MREGAITSENGNGYYSPPYREGQGVGLR